MLRTLLVFAGLLAAVPATASAAPLPRAERSSPLRWGELPFRSVTGTATCLRATGTPGELIRQTDENIELLGASASGLTAGATLSAGGPQRVTS